jgi:hypothetical protein
MSKAHRHAELMKFAADHWHEAEWRSKGSPAWRRLDGIVAPSWYENDEYEVRLIRPRVIQPRREIPAPHSAELFSGDQFFLADPTVTYETAVFRWNGSELQKRWLADGLVYLNREDRDERVRAMLGIEREGGQ